MSTKYCSDVPTDRVKKHNTLFSYWVERVLLNLTLALVTVPQLIVETCKHALEETTLKELTK